MAWVSDGGAARLLAHISAEAKAADWLGLLAPFESGSERTISLHLAVLTEPYLGFLLAGQKTVESRFSVRATTPFGRVARDDVVLVKAPGGPIVGAFTAAAVWHYRLDPRSWHDVRNEFSLALCAQDGFWDLRASASFATLMTVADVRRLPPVKIPKKDRRGWVVLLDRYHPSSLFE